MRYDLMAPCSNCPFLKNGGIRLTEARARQIAKNATSPNGKTFACHKTTKDVNGDLSETEDSRHCAGALILSEKYQNATQMMRIAERLRMYNARKMMSDKDVVAGVFDTVEEMVEANSDGVVQ